MRQPTRSSDFRAISSKARFALLVQLRTFRDELLVRLVDRDVWTTVDPLLTVRRGLVNRVLQDSPNERVKINRVSFMARTEVKYFAVAAFPRAAAAENLAAFKPRNKNNFVGRGDGERLAIHFSVFDFETAIDSLRNRVAGMANPEPLALSRLPPGERAARAH